MDFVTPVAAPVLNGVGQAVASQVAPMFTPPAFDGDLEERYARAEALAANPPSEEPSKATQALVLILAGIATYCTFSTFCRKKIIDAKTEDTK